jgi:HlyD family secretion protein
VLADLRPRFMALRELPDDQRAAERDKVTAELRQRVNAFLTPAQREAYLKLQAQAATSAATAASATLPAVAASAPASAPPRAARAPAAPGERASPLAGALREQRQRLIDELALTPEQVEQVDAIFAALRPRFGELRNLAEGERGKARDRILADMRAQIAERLTPEQKARYQKLQAESAGRQTTRGRIYLLGDDGKPRAYNVRLGISDGVTTELIMPPGSPDAAVLVEGAAVITAVVSAGTPPTGAARPGPRPF